MLYNKIETRIWNKNCNVRGQIIIYTSQQPMSLIDVRETVGFDIHKKIQSTLLNEPTAKLNGYAIAIGDLVDYRKMKPEDENLAFVPYLPERKCLIFENVKRIEPFILDRKFRGQGFRILDENEIKKIKYIKH